MKDEHQKGTIESLLETQGAIGKEKAIKSDVLMVATGNDRRTIQAMVERERDNGAFICADEKGYYIAADMQELQRFYVRYTAPARKMFHNIRHIAQTLKQIEGQEVFELNDPDSAA